MADLSAASENITEFFICFSLSFQTSMYGNIFIFRIKKDKIFFEDNL